MDGATISLVVGLAVPILAAVIGGLATAYFSRPKTEKKPTLLFDVSETEANISKIGLDFGENRHPNKIVVKSCSIENIGNVPVDSLTIEYKNLRKKPTQFHIENNPSASLLESYYNVSFSEERESLRIEFNHFPAGAKFSTDLTINDYWVIGGFQAHAKDGLVVSSKKYATDKEADFKTGKTRSTILYLTTLVALGAVIMLLILRVNHG